MYSDEWLPTGHERSPKWREIFETTFEGGSTRLARDEAWLSMLGFPEEEIDGLWSKYGVQIWYGDSPLEPICWLWFFSYLKCPMGWMLLSLMWRKTETTFRRVINSIIDALQPMLDEVRNTFVSTIWRSTF